MVRPLDVTSPRKRWHLYRVLDIDEKEKTTLAIGEWKKEGRKPRIVLAMRWNGDNDKDIGSPQSRGQPMWFIVPKRFNEAILTTLSASEDRTFAEGLLRREEK